MNRVLGITGLLLLAGCASYEPNGSSRAALPLPPDLEQYYSYSDQGIASAVLPIENQESYSVKKVSLAVPGSCRPIQIVWYAPTTKEPSPLILISPIRGSDTFVVDGIARMFAQHGYHAAIVKRFHYDFNPVGPLTQVEDFLHTAVIRQRQALDWLLSQPGVDGTRVGTFGISYGAIVNASLAAIEPRVKINVIDLAGGPLAGVMRSSDEQSLRRDWSGSRRCHELTDRQLYDAFQKIVRTDPVKLAPYVQRDNVLMLIARFDHSVPTKYQMNLWKALGKPRADFVPFGHYTSILALPVHRLSTMQFFTDRFDRPQPITQSVVIRNKDQAVIAATSVSKR